jgi:hypothetical protein
MNSRLQQQALPRSQRDNSPLPVPCSLSHTSQGSTTRVIGADITNRSPTPTPLLLPATSKNPQHRSPTAPASTRCTPPTDKTVVLSDPLTLSISVVGGTSNREKVEAPFLLPAFEHFFDALGKEGDSLIDEARQLPRRRSRSPAVAGICAADEIDDSAVEDEKDMHHERELRAREGRASPRSGGDTLQKDSDMQLRPPLKRARQQSNAGPDSGTPLVWSTCEKRADDEKQLLGFPFSAAGRPGSDATICDGHHASAFFTPISANLLLSNLVCRDGVPTVSPSSAVECTASPSRLRDESSVLTSVPPPPPPWMHTVAQPELPEPQRGSAHLCLSARLLDTRTPSWQMLTTADPSTTSRSAGLLLTTPQGDHRMRMMNAVDSTIVYSPSSLEDVSPILCLSEDHTMRRCSSCGQGHQLTPLHMQNEEGDRPRWSPPEYPGSNADAPSVGHALFPQVSGEEEEEEGNRKEIETDPPCAENAPPTHTVHSQLRDEALHLASTTFEEIQRSLLCWQ